MLRLHCGTASALAPEAITRKRYGPKVERRSALRNSFRAGAVRCPEIDGDEWARDLIERLLEKEPGRREGPTKL
jgi:hypothetical protein